MHVVFENVHLHVFNMLLHGACIYTIAHIDLFLSFQTPHSARTKSSQTQPKIHLLHINKIKGVYFDYLHIFVPI